MAFCGIAASNPSTFPSTNGVLRAFRHRHLVSLASSAAPNSGEREIGGGERVSSFPLKTQGNVAETRQPTPEKGMGAGSGDMMKLFNDTQQNMLYLNKQRLSAVEGLRRAERENELLLAKIGLLEAEKDASTADCEALRHQLKMFETKFGRGIGKQFKTGRRTNKVKMDLSSIFSELLLRIDSMVLTGAISEGQASSLRGLVLNKDTQAAELLSSVQAEDDKELASKLLPLLNPNQRSGLHVLHICTELDPVAKSGVVGAHVMGLSHALKRRGNVVEVILPKYAMINMDPVENLREIPADFYSFYGNRWHKNRAWTGIVYGIAVTFIEAFHPGGFFSRDHLYDYSDDFDRFTYFCRAALEYIVKSGKQPNILHLHNWQTAAVAPLFWDIFSGQGLGGTRILLTIHNFEYQGQHEPAKLALCGLDPQQLHRADRMQDNLDPGLTNILKGGIVYSNKVVTLSPVQESDFITRDYSHGLKSTLIAHRNKFVGTSSGLDEFLWDPSSDPFLPSVYSFENLEGKLLCKSHLRQELGLLTSDVSIPLVGCLAPNVSELELELIKAALDGATMKRSQFVFIGASKTPRVQMMVEDLQRELEGKGGRVFAKFDDSMAHLLIAASDILVCVSMNELTVQMPLIAMQYGAIPVLKQEGEFSGRIMDADDVSHWLEANAFIFQSAASHELVLALNRAIDCLMKDPQRWEELMQNGMSKDFSLDAACVEDYLAAYRSIRQL